MNACGDKKTCDTGGGASRWPYFSSLRFRILLLVLLAVVPALGLALRTSLEFHRGAAADAQRDTLRLAREAGAHQDELIREAHQLLIQLAKRPEVWSASANACHRDLAELRIYYPRYANIGVILPDGTVFCSAMRLTSRINVADLAYFQEAIKTRDFAVGEYQIGRATGKPSINFGYPVLDDAGEVRVVLFVALDLGWLNRFAFNAVLPPGSALTVIDRHGKVLAHQPEPNKWIGRPLPETPMIKTVLAHQGEGVVESVGADGVRRLYAFTPLHGEGTNADAYVCVGIPTSVAFFAANRVIIRNLSLIGTVAVLVLFVAWMAVDLFIRRRLLPLLAATQRLSAGDLSARTGLSGGPRELNQLAEAFDQMAESLQCRSEEQRQAEERNRSLVETARDAIVTIAADGTLASLNPAFETITGWSCSEWISKPFGPLVHRDDFPLAMEMFARVMSGEKPPSFELRVSSKTGQFVTVELTVTPQIQNGQVIGALGIARDITERRHLEEQLRQAQKMEAVGRLAGSIAHDFNNILTAISGYSELLLRRLDEDDPQRHAVEEIHKAGDRAAALTQQLLTFSRKQVVQTKVLDLNNVVGEIDAMLRRLIGEDVELRTVLRAEGGHVKADRGQIEQVIMNLVVNARDAMPTGGKLTIETANVTLDHAYARRHPDAVPGDYVILAVRDTGTGMTEQIKAHIFEPFFTTKGQGKGTGLGLATCFGIVKQGGGHIGVDTELGKGTTFKAYLPRVNAAAETASPSAERDDMPRGTESVLVVEDEPVVRELNSSVLRELGYTVLEATNGDEALRLALQCKKRGVDLLLTDVVMPQMGGKELAEKLRSVHPTAKVLFTSGYTEDTIRHDINDPAVAFLQKPFRPDYLARKVREVLDRASNQAS